MGDADTPPPGRRLPLRSLPLAQREVALIAVLCVISAAMFAGTRRLAAWSQARRAAAAAEWFTRGETLAGAGDQEGGINALREAVAADRRSAQYTLALARALGDAGRDDEARQLLLQLRQRQPDDVEINYRLAGLAASSGEAAEALRYYNYAMYGLARIGRDYERRQIRTELITWLIGRDENAEAVTQLGSLSRELPDAAPAQIQAARLAERAGDPGQARQFYARAAAIDPKSADAAAGLGRAAFEQRDFRAAVREMERAIDLGAAEAALEPRLSVARLVLAADPLAARLAGGERVRRARAGLARAADRYDACQRATAADPKAPDPTRTELSRYRRLPASALQDQDTLAGAVSFIGEVERGVAARCGSLVEPVDRAWMLVAGLHQGGGA